jgi:hypothetical protein
LKANREFQRPARLFVSRHRSRDRRCDLWIQYAELGSTQPARRKTDPEVPGLTGGNAFYKDALTILDGDMAQYIHDNTDDEITHAAFIHAYLAAHGASTDELDMLNGKEFRTIPGSTAAGSSGLSAAHEFDRAHN